MSSATNYLLKPVLLFERYIKQESSCACCCISSVWAPCLCHRSHSSSFRTKYYIQLSGCEPQKCVIYIFICRAVSRLQFLLSVNVTARWNGIHHWLTLHLSTGCLFTHSPVTSWMLDLYCNLCASTPLTELDRCVRKYNRIHCMPHQHNSNT